MQIAITKGRQTRPTSSSASAANTAAIRLGEILPQTRPDLRVVLAVRVPVARLAARRQRWRI